MTSVPIGHARIAEPPESRDRGGLHFAGGFRREKGRQPVDIGGRTVRATAEQPDRVGADFGRLLRIVGRRPRGREQAGQGFDGPLGVGIPIGKLLQ